MIVLDEVGHVICALAIRLAGNRYEHHILTSKLLVEVLQLRGHILTMDAG